MIKGVLGKPEEKAAEAQDDFEEEGSCSTPEKENVGEERTAVEGQIINILFEQIEVLKLRQKGKILSRLRRARRREDSRGLFQIENEVQAIPPLVSAQQSPAFVKSLLAFFSL